MFILTIIVETSPSLEHFFHSPMLKCLKILTLGCCQTARKKKQSCMLKCCISKFYNTVTICHKRNISPWVQLWWGLLFLSTEHYSTAPVTWTLRGNEKQFELAGNSSYWSRCLKNKIKCTNIHHLYKHWKCIIQRPRQRVSPWGPKVKLFAEIYRKCLSQGRCARVSLRPSSDAKLSMSWT